MEILRTFDPRDRELAIKHMHSTWDNRLDSPPRESQIEREIQDVRGLLPFETSMIEAHVYECANPSRVNASCTPYGDNLKYHVLKTGSFNSHFTIEGEIDGFYIVIGEDVEPFGPILRHELAHAKSYYLDRESEEHSEEFRKYVSELGGKQ